MVYRYQCLPFLLPCFNWFFLIGYFKLQIFFLSIFLINVCLFFLIPLFINHFTVSVKNWKKKIKLNEKLYILSGLRFIIFIYLSMLTRFIYLSKKRYSNVRFIAILLCKMLMFFFLFFFKVILLKDYSVKDDSVIIRSSTRRFK